MTQKKEEEIILTPQEVRKELLDFKNRRDALDRKIGGLEKWLGKNQLHTPKRAVKKVKAWIYFWPDSSWQIVPKRLLNKTTKPLHVERYHCEISYSPTNKKEKQK